MSAGTTPRDDPYTKAAPPEDVLFVVFSRPALRWFASISVVLAIALILFGIFAPFTYNNAISRYCVCLLASLTLSIFFFAVWPHRPEAKVTAISGWEFGKVTGPIVLFFLLFFVLVSYFPSVSGESRYFSIQLRKASGEIVVLPHESIDILLQSEGRIDKVIDNTGNLLGVVAQFPAQNRVMATVSSRVFQLKSEKIELSSASSPTVILDIGVRKQ